jgi:hypothetical protein
MNHDSSVFESYEEFWNYCFSRCGEFKVGCAKSCEIRKSLGIPPFEKSYLGKLEGKVKLKA